MSKNYEYVSHMRKLFFFSADPTTNLRPGETGQHCYPNIIVLVQITIANDDTETNNSV